MPSLPISIDPNVRTVSQHDTDHETLHADNNVIAAKGDIPVGSGPFTWNKISLSGVDGHVLTEDSTQPTGVKWAVGGGGGGCSPKLYYTVASVGPAAFGGLGSTPEPFRSCADFIGNGASDDVAVQAAIDFSGAAAPFNPIPIFIYAGYYVFAASIDTKGVRIIGSGKTRTVIGTSATVGGPGGVRLIDNTVSLAPIDIEHLWIQPGGAAAVRNEGVDVVTLRMVDILLQAFGDSGADGAFIAINQAGSVIINNCEFYTTTVSGVHDAIRMVNGILPAPKIINNFFSGAGILLDTVSHAHIVDNVFTNIYTGGGIGEPTYTIKLTGTSRFNIISNNTLSTLQHEGIVLDGTGGQVLQNQITGNFINLYAISGSVTEDGIRLAGDADENLVQHNTVRTSAVGNGRHGVNISAGTCNNNFVTNNDLLNSGTGTSVNDAGTGTVLAAGNRL